MAHFEACPPPEPDWTQQPYPSRIPVGDVIEIVDANTVRINVALDGGANQFEGGSITFLDAVGAVLGTRTVLENTTGATPTVKVDGGVPVGAAKFRNLDDDDIEHNITADDMVPRLYAFQEKYRPALIAMSPRANLHPTDPNGTVNQNDLPFKLHVPSGGVDVPAQLDAYRGSESEDDFWIIYLQGAFQGAKEEDNDPDNEVHGDGTQAQLMGLAVLGKGAILFRETIADVKREENPAGGWHASKCAMCVSHMPNHR